MGAQAVKALFFDKTEPANWPVPWHQDLTLAVDGPKDAPGWSAWTVKGGISHAQAPAPLLERMLTLRLHLDDCLADDGPLRVLEGTHLLGRLGRAEISDLSRKAGEKTCAVLRGDVLAIRPLILHASSPAKNPSHRRVLHMEFAPPGLLPEGFTWATI